MFFIILDDHSNFGHTVLLNWKNDAFEAYLAVTTRWERKSGNLVMKLRSDGAKELVQGIFSEHVTAKGIEHQVTVPYAHSQNGKAERYVRTLEDTAQMLLADSGLPLEFYGDAVLTAQYLRNRLPTSTLPSPTTPFEVIEGVKPDLSHLRVWGCQCFAIIPPEKWTKGGPHRFEAIFVGYEEGRVGWRIHDMNGKYSFSRDIIFNEDVRSNLKCSCVSQPSPLALADVPPEPRPRRLLNPTERGQLWTDAIHARNAHLQQLRAARAGDNPDVSGGAPAASGGDILHLQQSLIAVKDFASLATLTTVEDHFDDMSLLEFSVISEHMSLAAHPNPLRLPKTFDLSKAPLNFCEARARPDADV